MTNKKFENKKLKHTSIKINLLKNIKINTLMLEKATFCLVKYC